MLIEKGRIVVIPAGSLLDIAIYSDIIGEKKYSHCVRVAVNHDIDFVVCDNFIAEQVDTLFKEVNNGFWDEENVYDVPFLLNKLMRDGHLVGGYYLIQK